MMTVGKDGCVPKGGWAASSLCGQRDALDDGRLTSVELIRASLDRIALYDLAGPQITAIAAVAPDLLEHAERVDEERRQGRLRGVLHGLPVLVKDNFETMDMPTTAGSKTLENWRPQRDAELVKRLKGAGAIVLAKTNMHEFAFGYLGCGSLFGQVRNPYDSSRIAGGSSSGTGAGIAAGYAAAGLGTDTCGSIGIPSAFCGIAGLRPTQGLTSRRGIIPVSSTQDIGGPMARSVADLALLLDILAGTDPGDAQTVDADVNKPKSYFGRIRENGVRRARIGRVTSRFDTEPKDEEVVAAVDRSLEVLARDGAEIVDVEMPTLQALIEDELKGGFVLIHDFSFDLDRYLAGSTDAPLRSFRELLGSRLTHPSLRNNLGLASAILTRDTPEYRSHLGRREQLAALMVSTMNDNNLDALGYPTVRCPPPPIGTPVKGVNSHMGANSGLPVLTVPCGMLDGLPIGIDFLARPWGEADLLSLGRAVEDVWGGMSFPLT